METNITQTNTSSPINPNSSQQPQDFRLYLQSVLTSRCQRNPRYSLRAFALCLGVDHSTLSQIIRGKRTIGPKMHMKLSEKLGFGPEEQKRFFISRPEPRKNQTSAESAKRMAMAQHSQDLIWTLDMATGRFSYVGPTVKRLRGYTPEEAIGMGLKDSLTPESYQKVLENFKQRLEAFAHGDESARVQTCMMEQLRKDGSVVRTEVVTTLLTDENDKVTEILAVSRDAEHHLESHQLSGLPEWMTGATSPIQVAP